MARLTGDDVPKLKLKWAFGFPGVNRAFAQPTVVGGRVFVGSASSVVYLLSASTGCQHWSFKTDAPVRAAISIGPRDVGGARRWTAYFADQITNVYAVDAVTGELLWKRRVDDFRGATITGAPTLAGDALYVGTSSVEEVLGANIKYECCKSAAASSRSMALPERCAGEASRSPRIRNRCARTSWACNSGDRQGAGVWSSPTVDVERGLVYVTTGDSYSDPPASTSDAFIAIDAKTGKLLWSRQTTAGDAFTIDCGWPRSSRRTVRRRKGRKSTSERQP